MQRKLAVLGRVPLLKCNQGKYFEIGTEPQTTEVKDPCPTSVPPVHHRGTRTAISEGY